MSFLNPLFLFAIISVAVPLLIYLLNVRKPKRIKFSTLAFFESLKSSSLRKIKIKRWLLLALRTLAVLALALALAKPFIPSGMGVLSSNEPRAVGVLIDNGPAMNQVDRNGPYIQQAIEIAEELIGSKSNEDRFFLDVTNGSSLNLPLLTKSTAGRELTSIEVQNAGNYLDKRIEEMVKSIEEAREPNKIIYIITDGRESQLQKLTELEREQKFGIQVSLIRLGNAEPANVGFENVDISTEEDQVFIRATIRNFGEQTASNQFLSLIIEGDMIVQQPYEIGSGEMEEFLFNIPETEENYIPAELRIEGDELTYDNRFYAAISLPEKKNLLVIESAEQTRDGFRPYLRPMLNAAVEVNKSFEVEYSSISDVSPDQFSNYDAIVLNSVRSIPDYLSQPLIDHVQNGAGLLLLPAADGSISSYNNLLGFGNAGRYQDVVGRYGSFEAIDRLATPTEGHPIIETIFDKRDEDQIRINVPEIFYYYRIDGGSSRLSTPILSTRTGSVLLNESQVGNGRIIYSAIGSDPGWSNFPIKPFFAPIFTRTVNYLVSGEGAELNNHILGEPFRTEISSGTAGEIELEVKDETIIPDVRQTFRGIEVSYHGIEWTPGWVNIRQNGQHFLHAVNLDAMESSLFSLDEQRLIELLELSFSNVDYRYLNQQDDTEMLDLLSDSFSKEIWHWFIILAMGLLLTESIVSRTYKAESIS